MSETEHVVEDTEDIRLTKACDEVLDQLIPVTSGYLPDLMSRLAEALLNAPEEVRRYLGEALVDPLHPYRSSYETDENWREPQDCD